MIDRDILRVVPATGSSSRTSIAAWPRAAIGVLLACWIGILVPTSRAHAQSGINITKADAMKSDDADQWLKDTVSGIRDKVRRKNSSPNELAGSFIGAPFGTAIKDLTTARGNMRAGCGFAAAVVAGGAVEDFEQLWSGPTGAAVNTVKGAIDLGKSIYDAGSSVASAGGTTLAKKAGEMAVDAVKGTAEDIAKDAAKGAAGDLVKGQKPDIAGKVGEAVQGKIDDAKEFAEGLKDFFKDGPIIFAYSTTKSACNIVLLWVWDEKSLDLYVRGTCDCKSKDSYILPAGNSSELSSFFFHMRAKTIPTGQSGILKFKLGDVLLVEMDFQCGCPKPKTATGYQPAPPAVCPRCFNLARQIADLDKDIEKKENESMQANGLIRQARMGNDDTAAQEATEKKAKIDSDLETLKKERDKAKKEKEDCEKAPCDQPKTGSYVYPRYSKEQYITYATDGTEHCTYTEGTTTSEFINWVDPGTVVGGTDDTPKSPYNPQSTPTPGPSDTPKGPDQPTPKGQTPGPSTDNTPKTPTPVSTPVTPPPDKPTTTTDITPPADPDTPSDIPDNVEAKVTEEVLEGGPTGTPLEGQTIKLLLADKPDLPGTGDRTAQDTGYDKPPAQCVTGAQGDCTIKVVADDRPHYNLPPATKSKPGNYRLEFARPRTSGGVAETTARKNPVDLKLLQGVGSKIAATSFSIGARTFTRFALEDKYGADDKVAEKLKEAYGSTYEEDLCEEKRPGPSSGGEGNRSGPANSELPRLTVRLRQHHGARQVVR